MTAEDIFTAADGAEQRADFMHIAIEGSPVRKGGDYRCASLYLKDGGRMTFYLPDEGVTVEELLQRENFLQEAEDLLVDALEVRVNWSVPKFDLHDSLKLNDALQALGVTDAFDENKADFAPLTEQPAYVESVNQAARVKIDEDGCEAAAYTILGITIGVFCGMVFIWITKLLYNTDAVNAEYALPDSYTMPTERTKTLLKELVVIAIPVTLSSSVMSLANLVDLMVVSRRLQASGLSEKAAAALYGNYTTLAVPLFNLPPVLVYPIGYSLVPMLSALIVQKDEGRLQRTMNSSLKVAAILSIPCAVGMAALAEPILLMIFGNESGSAATAAPLLATLAVSSFLVSMLAITNSVLQAHKKEVLPLISMLTGAAAKIVISYLLIGNPNIRMFGAPISTDICYVIVVLMNFYFCARYASLRPNLVSVFVKPLISAALCGGAAIGGYALAEHTIAHQRLDTILAIAAAVIVYVLGILLTRCLAAEDFEFIPGGKKIYAILNRAHLIKE